VRGGDHTTSVRIPAARVELAGDLGIPEGATGIVVFAHGSGSSRLSTRNQAVARRLREAGLATLLFDLLTEEEERVDTVTREHRFDIPRLAERLVQVTDWLTQDPRTAPLRIGYFGASTGAAAALVAAAERPDAVRAVVSRGGRPDLAAAALGRVRAPTLLIVGGLDVPVIGMNQEAFDGLEVEKLMQIVPGATHLFPEPGALEVVADLTADWFGRHLSA
jgi:dienelactone hydrolase